MAPNAKANDLQPENVQTTLSMEELLTISPEYALTAGEMFLENYSNGTSGIPKWAKWLKNTVKIVRNIVDKIAIGLGGLQRILDEWYPGQSNGGNGGGSGGNGGVEVQLDLEQFMNNASAYLEGSTLIIEEDVIIGNEDDGEVSYYIEAGEYENQGEDFFQLNYKVY